MKQIPIRFRTKKELQLWEKLRALACEENSSINKLIIDIISDFFRK